MRQLGPDHMGLVGYCEDFGFSSERTGEPLKRVCAEKRPDLASDLKRPL